MTRFAQIITELMSAGLKGEELSAAVERIEMSERNEERNEPSRSSLRQKRYRERQKALQTVTCDAQTVTNRNGGDVSDYKVNNNPSNSEVDTKKRNNGAKRVTRHAYSALFETFWKAYPKDENMSKWEASREFERMSADDQQAAIDSAPGFRAYCSKNRDYRPVHAIRYLKWRRFEGFNGEVSNVASSFVTPHKNSPLPGETRQEWLARTRSM